MSQTEVSPTGSVSRPGRYGSSALLVIGLTVVVISVVFFVLSMFKPFMGVDLALEGQTWEVHSVDESGAAYRAGVRVGDRPTEINGEAADVFLQRYEKAGVVFGNLISRITLVGATGQTRSVAIADSLPSVSSAVDAVAWLIVSSVFWLTGLFVYMKRPDNIAAVLLRVTGLAFGLALGANTAGIRGIPFAVELAVAGALFVPWLLGHFFLALPEERTRLRTSRLVYVIYLIPAVTLMLFFLIGYVDGQPVGWFRTARLIEYGVGLLAAVGIVIWNYVGAASLKTKLQMRVVAFSCLVALVPAIVFNVLPASIWGQPIVPGTMVVMFVSAIPLGMGYAVVTQRLMDIDVVIRRAWIYGLVTAMMAVILAAAVFPVLLFRQSIGIPETVLIALVLGGIATALFGPAKKWAEILVDRLFYRDRYDYREIIHTASLALNQMRDFADISRLVVRKAVETLNLAGGCMFYRTPSGVYALSAAMGDFAETEAQDRLLDLVSTRSVLRESPASAAKALSDVAFMMPLMAGDKEVGVLCLSHKTSRQEFSSDDMFLLESLATLAALALHRATLIHDVSMRDTFVSIASHELRTPLTSILGYADLLVRRDPPEETRKKWLGTLLDNSNKLAAMVEDMLNVSRIQSGRMNVKLDRTRLRDILDELLSMVQDLNGKHQFVVDVEPDLPDALADRAKLEQVVGNLLSNAVKYSPGGGRVTLAARADMDEGRVVISVSDQGIGISRQDMNSLFTTFHRIQRPETIGIRGSGLGLYIAREWTEAMGGKIWLESELNRGSTFYVGIPVAKPGPAPEEFPQTRSEANSAIGATSDKERG